jgi:hypothetical protein
VCWNFSLKNSNIQCIYICTCSSSIKQHCRYNSSTCTRNTNSIKVPRKEAEINTFLKEGMSKNQQ